MVTYGGEQSLDRYLALSARGIPFNVAHALGNFAIAFAAGPALVAMIERYRTRTRVPLAPGGSAPGGARRAGAGDGRAAVRGGAAGPGSARSWLEHAREDSGGYAATPGSRAEPADDRLGDARPRGRRAQPARRRPARAHTRRLPGGPVGADPLGQRARAGDPRPGGRGPRREPVRRAQPGGRASRRAVRRRLVAGPGEPDRLRGPGASRRRQLGRRRPRGELAARRAAGRRRLGVRPLAAVGSRLDGSRDAGARGGRRGRASTEASPICAGPSGGRAAGA